MARESVIYVMGILGNRNWPLGFSGNPTGMDGHPLLQQHQESRSTNTG